MHLASLHRDDLLPQAPDSMRRGLLLAIAAHVVLVAALAFGVSWHSSEPTGAQAELWAAVPQVAAQRATSPEPEPPPPPPKPRPEPAREAEAPERPVPDPQIAIEREKARKEKLKEEREKKEREDKQAREKLEREKKEREKKERDKQQREDQQRDDKKLAEQKKKQQQLDQARADAVRAEQLRRNQRLLGSDSGSPNGSATSTAAPSSGYGGKVREAIRPNIRMTPVDQIDGNPATVVEVHLGADGSIIGRRVKKSSGVPRWDELVLLGIDRTAKLPLDNGRVITPMELTIRPQD